MALRLLAGVCSDVGAFRDVNQDAAFAAPWGGGVADGVGGGPAGDLASAALVHRLVAGGAECADPDELASRIRIANWDLAQHVRRDPALRGMATTFTGVWFDRSGALLLAHTGDSRAYLLRDGQLSRQTRDDSFVQALVDQGLMTEADAAVHPRRNIITASLRGDALDRVSVSRRVPVVGDRWLLCSDGISDYVPHDLLTAVLASAGTAQEAAELIVGTALEAATRDNATAVVCDVVEVASPAPFRADDLRFAGAALARFHEDLEGLTSAS
ncbi:PP2C family protein-serine/threonine phosphatase [Microbacterium sp. bgisy189]|uniref:PP2C family protein-serine/threonine phosphatase n=1 Tax=Microbacterium sp. bgisy189 TaxID=3413798 RepID=UPI003EBD6129